MTADIERIGEQIYVPRIGSQLRKTIKAGSGIVGTTQPNGKVLIDYEGAIHGQAMSYEEKILHAHGRHTHEGVGYPTVARMLVEPTELVQVGEYLGETNRQVVIFDQVALDEWLAE